MPVRVAEPRLPPGHIVWRRDFHGTGLQKDMRDAPTTKAVTFDKPAAARVEGFKQKGMLDNTPVL